MQTFLQCDKVLSSVPCGIPKLHESPALPQSPASPERRLPLMLSLCLCFHSCPRQRPPAVWSGGGLCFFISLRLLTVTCESPCGYSFPTKVTHGALSREAKKDLLGALQGPGEELGGLGEATETETRGGVYHAQSHRACLSRGVAFDPGVPVPKPRKQRVRGSIPGLVTTVNYQLEEGLAKWRGTHTHTHTHTRTHALLSYH